MKRLILILLLLIITCFARVIPPMKSIREAIEVRWLPPEEPFRVGEIPYFKVVAKNIAADTAICYALSSGEINGDSIEPYAVISLRDKYVNDTLAPGETSSYVFTLIDGTTWLYDPLKDVRSYKEPVGLPCLPAGDYTLTYMVMWGKRDKIDFQVVPQEDPTQQLVLDSLAQAAVAYLVGRPEDAIRNARFCYRTDPTSPLTARALILARGVAWEEELCDSAIEMDSLFWSSFGQKAQRHKYLPNPGFFSPSTAVLSRCSHDKRTRNYLDWLGNTIGDGAMQQQLQKARQKFQE